MKGQYTNNSSLVKSTLNLHTRENAFLMLVYALIFPSPTSTRNGGVQIHAYSKDVGSMCLLGHITGINLHLYEVEFAMTSNHHVPSAS
jgi:hypothetical protein